MTEDGSPVPARSEALPGARTRFHIASLVALGVTVATLAALLLLAVRDGWNSETVVVLPLVFVAVVHWRGRHGQRSADVRAGRVVGFVGVALAAVLLLVAGSALERPWMLLAVRAVVVALLLAHLAVIAASWPLIARGRAEARPTIGLQTWLAVAVIVVVAAVVVIPPGHSRIPGNESATIGDLRTMSAAQAAYEASGGEAFGEPSCLVRPSECLPGYAADAPLFLDASFLVEVRHGYRLTFHPGPRGPAPTRKGARPGLSRYAYTALPERFGKTGYRSFCLDADGIIGFKAENAPLEVKDGRCPEGLETLN